jgi:hypothetical protein
MNYISLHSGRRDGKLLAIGHSMGGILLYAMVAKCCKILLDFLFLFYFFWFILVICPVADLVTKNGVQRTPFFFIKLYMYI